MPAGPRRTRRAARLQRDLDQRGTAGDELADCRAGCLDIGHLQSDAGAEHRDRIATGCGEDRPGAQHPQPPIATGGCHQRTAGVPNCREAVPQDRFRWDLPKQQVGMQVDKAGKHRAGKADEGAWAGEAVGWCHGRDPVAPDRDRVVLEHSPAVEHPVRGDDVPVAESWPCGLLASGHDGLSFRLGLILRGRYEPRVLGGVTRRCTCQVESFCGPPWHEGAAGSTHAGQAAGDASRGSPVRARKDDDGSCHGVPLARLVVIMRPAGDRRHAVVR